MANHTGYVFITPNGDFLTRIPYIGRSPVYNWRMGLSSHLDCALLLPFSAITGQSTDEYWQDVVTSLTAENIKDAIQKLTALPATSFQSIRIGKTDEHES